MNQNEIMGMVFSGLVNQSIEYQNSKHTNLPDDQQEAIDKMLKAIHDFCENKAIIKPEYQADAFAASVLKVAAELGWNAGR